MSARHEMVVASPAMRQLLSTAERAARTSAKVLISGESGVGKDLVARHIHHHSLRRCGPFVAVNCAGLAETLLESELFGHVKGSFTGAFRDKRGKIQLAHGGTLFLDEVGEMSLRMQAILLRLLENGEIQPVGSDRPSAHVDVRVVAATNRNLAELVAAGEFREDLFYRLCVIHLRVPPLRERPEDVQALLTHFLARADRDLMFTDEAIRAVLEYSWPGNVREMMNVLEHVGCLSATGVVRAFDLPAPIRNARRAETSPSARRRAADDLYDALVKQKASFWQHVYPMFLARDITRDDLRDLVRRGLQESRGRYKSLLTLFGLPVTDYRRFMNFLAAHECSVAVREFRTGPVLVEPRVSRTSTYVPDALPAQPAVAV